MNLRWRLAQAAEIRWWQFYLRRKDAHTYLGRKKAYWRRVLDEAALSLPPGARVLDAGCGPAGVFIILDHCRVDGLDPLLSSYEEKLAHFSRDAYPWTHFLPRPLESLTARQVYQTVFCMNALNHVADLSLATDRLVDSLQPGGQLVLSVDVHRHAFLKTLFRRIPGDILHPHQLALDDYQDLLTQRGIRIERVRKLKTGNIFDFYLIVGRKTKWMLGGC